MGAGVSRVGRLIASFEGLNFLCSSDREVACGRLIAIGEPAIPDLLAVVDSRSANVRACACLALGGIGTDEAVSAIVKRLSDRQKDVRQSAARGLAAAAEKRIATVQALTGASKRLMRRFAVEKDQITRTSLLFSLGAIGMASGLSFIADATTDSDIYVAPAAAKILMEKKDDRCASGMIDICRRACNEDWEEYDFYGDCLSVLVGAGPKGIPILLEALRDESDPVRAIAVVALGYVGDATIVPSILELLRDSSDLVLESALDALCRLKTPEAIDAVLPLVETSAVRPMSIRALRDAEDLRVVDACVRLLSSFDPLKACFAGEVLGSMGDAGVMALVGSLNASTASVRHTIVTALRIAVEEKPSPLSSETGQVVTRALIGLLTDPDGSLRREAARALEFHADMIAADALLASLDDPEARGTVAGALGRLGDRRATKRICELLAEDPRSAARALWLMADPASVPALISACAHEDFCVRESVVMALGWIGDVNAVPVLTRVLTRDPDSRARRGALYALAAFGARREELEYALWEDVSVGVYRAANTALARFGDKHLCHPDDSAAGRKVGSA